MSTTDFQFKSFSGKTRWMEPAGDELTREAEGKNEPRSKSVSDGRRGNFSYISSNKTFLFDKK